MSIFSFQVKITPQHGAIDLIPPSVITYIPNGPVDRSKINVYEAILAPFIKHLKLNLQAFAFSISRDGAHVPLQPNTSSKDIEDIIVDLLNVVEYNTQGEIADIYHQGDSKFCSETLSIKLVDSSRANSRAPMELEIDGDHHVNNLSKEQQIEDLNFPWPSIKAVFPTNVQDGISLFKLVHNYFLHSFLVSENAFPSYENISAFIKQRSNHFALLGGSGFLASLSNNFVAGNYKDPVLEQPNTFIDLLKKLSSEGSIDTNQDSIFSLGNIHEGYKLHIFPVENSSKLESPEFVNELRGVIGISPDANLDEQVKDFNNTNVLHVATDNEGPAVDSIAQDKSFENPESVQGLNETTFEKSESKKPEQSDEIKKDFKNSDEPVTNVYSNDDSLANGAGNQDFNDKQYEQTNKDDKTLENDSTNKAQDDSEKSIRLSMSFSVFKNIASDFVGFAKGSTRKESKSSDNKDDGNTITRENAVDDDVDFSLVADIETKANDAKKNIEDNVEENGKEIVEKNTENKTDINTKMILNEDDVENIDAGTNEDDEPELISQDHVEKQTIVANDDVNNKNLTEQMEDDAIDISDNELIEPEELGRPQVFDGSKLPAPNFHSATSSEELETPQVVVTPEKTRDFEEKPIKSDFSFEDSAVEANSTKRSYYESNSEDSDDGIELVLSSIPQDIKEIPKDSIIDSRELFRSHKASVLSFDKGRGKSGLNNVTSEIRLTTLVDETSKSRKLKDLSSEDSDIVELGSDTKSENDVKPKRQIAKQEKTTQPNKKRGRPPKNVTTTKVPATKTTSKRIRIKLPENLDDSSLDVEFVKEDTINIEPEQTKKSPRLLSKKILPEQDVKQETKPVLWPKKTTLVNTLTKNISLRTLGKKEYDQTFKFKKLNGKPTKMPRKTDWQNDSQIFVDMLSSDSDADFVSHPESDIELVTVPQEKPKKRKYNVKVKPSKKLLGRIDKVSRSQLDAIRSIAKRSKEPPLLKAEKEKQANDMDDMSNSSSEQHRKNITDKRRRLSRDLSEVVINVKNPYKTEKIGTVKKNPLLAYLPRQTKRTQRDEPYDKLKSTSLPVIDLFQDSSDDHENNHHTENASFVLLPVSIKPRNLGPKSRHQRHDEYGEYRLKPSRKRRKGSYKARDRVDLSPDEFEFVDRTPYKFQDFSKSSENIVLEQSSNNEHHSGRHLRNNAVTRQNISSSVIELNKAHSIRVKRHARRRKDIYKILQENGLSVKDRIKKYFESQKDSESESDSGENQFVRDIHY